MEFGTSAKFSTGAYPNTSTTTHRDACAYSNTFALTHCNACTITHSNAVVTYADT
ncbi:MAG: hypothetical protein H8E47_11320 [Anaerolineales bacterium]|nr:hypothetical protein [Anaerolineales bacterium]